VLTVVDKIPDEVRWFRDESGERFMACPHPGCAGHLIPTVGGGGICIACNRTRTIPSPPRDLCPHCGGELRSRIDGEAGQVCPRCGPQPEPWVDAWHRLKSGERAVVKLIFAMMRLGTHESPGAPEPKTTGEGSRRDRNKAGIVPSSLGPMIERLSLGKVQIQSFPISISEAHLILGDLGPRFSRLDEEDQLHLGLSVPDILAQMDKEPTGSKWGRPLDIAQRLSEHRLSLYIRDHPRPKGPEQLIVKHGLETQGEHLANQGRCLGCGRWHKGQRRGQRDYYRRERCTCGARIRWGLVVRWDRLRQLYNQALGRWERELRREPEREGP